MIRVVLCLLKHKADPLIASFAMFSIPPLLRLDPRYKSTLLHKACQLRAPPLGEVDFNILVNACEAATRTVNGAGLFPIQEAILNHQPLGNIALLVETNALSISMLTNIRQMCVDGKISITYLNQILMVSSAVNGSELRNTTHIHLCGDGGVGKSTITLALKETLKLQGSVESFALSYRSPSTNPTVGMHCEFIPYGNQIYIVHDYGGQDEFHINHPAFLSAPRSIYIIVLPSPHSRVDVETKYLYWLKFIASVVDKNSVSTCITLVNRLCSPFWPIVSLQHANEFTSLDNIRTNWLKTFKYKSNLIFTPKCQEVFAIVPRDVWYCLNTTILSIISEHNSHCNNVMTPSA